VVAENLKLVIETEVSAALAKLKQFQQETEKTKKSFDFSHVSEQMVHAGKIMSIGVTAPLVLLGRQAVKAAANLEMQAAAFETMLGSAEAAGKMITDLREMAAKTPFSMEDLAGATKTMLGFGIESEKVLPYLKQLGDISGGNAGRFNSLALAFSQVQAAGRLMGQDLLQMINAGFNPLKVISGATGESMAELKTRMEKGGISAEEVAKAFEAATSAGGLFAGGMERAAQTFSGQMSTLKDDIVMLGVSFAEILMPVIKQVMNYVSGLVEWFNGLSDSTKRTITQALALAAALGPVLIIGGKLLSGIGTLMKVFQGFGSVLSLVSSGPLGLILVGVAALAAAAYLIIKNWDSISAFFVGVWDSVKAAFANAWEAIKGFLEKNWPTIVGIITGPLGFAVVKVIQNWDSIVAAFQNAYERIKALVIAIKEWLTDKLGAIIEPVKKVAEGVKDAFAWLSDKLVGKSIIPDMVDMIQVEIDRLNAIMGDDSGAKQMVANLEDARDTISSVQNAIAPFADAFGQMVVDSKRGAEAMKDAMRDAMASIMKMLAEQAFAKAAEALAEALGGNLAKIPAIAAWTAAGTAALAAAGAIKALGTGGIVTRPTMALVGERGPEAVIPLNRAGGMGPTVIVNVQGSVLEEEGLARRITRVMEGAGRGY